MLALLTLRYAVKHFDFLEMRVSKIRVKRIRVNQGLGVTFCQKVTVHKDQKSPS